MRRLCELCGAKLYAEDRACRQCGTPTDTEGPPTDQGAEEESYADLLPERPAESIAAVDGPPAAADAHDDPAFAYTGPGRTPTDPGLADEVVTETDGIRTAAFDTPELGVDDDLDPPRRGLAVTVALAVLVVGGGAAWWLWPSDDDGVAVADPEGEADVAAPAPAVEADRPSTAAGCEALEALAGHWELTTEIVTSSNLAQLGMHGFFTLSVDVDGCSATAELTKIGYTGRWYDEGRIQRGKAELRPGPHFGFVGAFDLRDTGGRGGKQEIVLAVHEHRLTGTYRMPGRTGFLEGARDPGRRILPVLDAQPCLARCAVACDLLRRDPDDAAIRGAFDRCQTTCAASDERVCGDAKPLPESFVVPIGGPAGGLGAACTKLGRAGCRTEVKVRKKAAPSVSGKGDEPWRAAQFVLAARAIHLGLRTPAGWFAAGPILELDGAELTRARLYARDLGSGADDRYVLGELETSARAVTFACRLDGDAPRCVAIPADASVVSPLPAHAVAVGKSTDAIEAGVYTW